MPSDYERTEQGDDPSGPRTERAIIEMKFGELIDENDALRARVAQLEAGGEPNSYEARMDAYGKKIDELMARNAQLEAALRQIYDQVEDVGLERIARAALKDAPR